MTNSIPISGLNELSSLKITDFVPVVLSGSLTSLTTYRTPISAFKNFIADSGSVISASWASASISASYARWADSASYLYPNILYRTTASNAISASWAENTPAAMSSSHAIWADSASYLYPTILYRTTASNAISASWAQESRFSTSSSFASRSISSSYALRASSASYAPMPPAFETGMVILWPSIASIPSGWLRCNNSVFSNVTYPALATLIGTTYGSAFTGDVGIHGEVPSVYGDANNGYIIVAPHTGTGVYSVTLGATTYYPTNAVTVTFTLLNAGTYSLIMKDLLRNPTSSYTLPVTVPYANNYFVYPFAASSAEYRTPPTYTNVPPFIYIIKT